jgi:hypothetical protein
MQPDVALRVLPEFQWALAPQRVLVVCRQLRPLVQQVFAPLLQELVQQQLRRLSLQRPSLQQLSSQVLSLLECRRPLRLVRRQA